MAADLTVTQTPTMFRATHASGLHTVERQLAELHREMLRVGEETRAVRLSVVTLVVACVDAEAADRAAEVIGVVAADHPARAILVLADPDAPPGIDAELRLQCSVQGDHERVCAEQVRLVVGGEPAYHMVSVVTPLLLPDVPVILWLCGAVPPRQALTGEAPDICERIVVDSDAYADPEATLAELAEALEGSTREVPLADIAWTRLLPWRESIAQAFDGTAMRRYLGGVEEVTVETAGPVAAARSRLLAGWLRSRLRSLDGAPTRVALRAAAGDDGGPVAVWLRSVDPASGAASVEVRAQGDVLVTRVITEAGSDTTRVLRLVDPPLHDLVGSVLEEGGADPVHLEALRAAVSMDMADR